MATRLSERTGQPFHLITRQEDLTPERLREIAPRDVFFPHWSDLIPPASHEGWECVHHPRRAVGRESAAHPAEPRDDVAVARPEADAPRSSDG